MHKIHKMKAECEYNICSSLFFLCQHTGCSGIQFEIMRLKVLRFVFRATLRILVLNFCIMTPCILVDA